MINNKIAKLTSYGSYLDCEFIYAKYPDDEVHIVGDLAEYVYDLEQESDKKDQKIAELETRIKELEKRLNSETLSFIPNGAMSIKDTAEENTKMLEKFIRRHLNNDK